MVLPPWLRDEADLEAACYAVGQFISTRRRQGRPVPPEVLRLYRQLELSALTAMSDRGHESDCRIEQSKQELIDTEQAADILSCTARHIRRLTRDLDGQHIAGRWVFRRHTVEDYQEARTDGRRPTGTG